MVQAITPRALIFGLVFSVLYLLTYLNAGFYAGQISLPFPRMHWDHRVGVESWQIMGAFIWVPLIFAFLPKKLRLTPFEIAFVYAMFLPIPWISAVPHGGILHVWQVYQSISTYPWIQQYLRLIPDFISPKSESVLNMVRYGKAAVPWSLYYVPMAVWMTYFLSLFLFLVFGTNILTHLYVDVEALPFPIAMASTAVIKSAEGNGSLFRTKYFWTGVLISAIFAFLDEPYLVPALGTVPLLEMGDTNVATLEFNQVFPTTIQVGFGLEPWIIGLGLIVPMDILVTTIISFIAFQWIYPLIAVPIGEMNPAAATLGSNWAAKTMEIVYRNHPPGAFFQQGWLMFIYAWLCMIVFWPLIVHRGVWLGTLKQAFGGQSEDREAASYYRTNWIGWIVCGLVFLVMLVAFGFQVHHAILSFLTVGIMWWSIARIAAETGAGWGGYWRNHHSPMTFTYISAYTMTMHYSGVVTPETAMPTFSVWGLIQPMDHGWNVEANPAPWLLEGSKVASNFKAKPKDVLSVQILGVVIGTVITLFATLILVFNYGFARFNWGLVRYLHFWGRMENIINNTYWHGMEAATPNLGTLITFIGGIIVYIVVWYLRNLGGIFTLLNPVALIFGLNDWGPWHFLPFIIAAIAKYITSRVGGIELQERTTFPFGIGLYIGWCIMWLPQAIVLIVRQMYGI